MAQVRYEKTSSAVTALLWLQGIYYFVTGIWPLVSIETFLMVTGPKTDHLQSPNPVASDHWLVMTVGVLIVAVSLALLAAAWRRRPSLEIGILAAASAIGLASIDVIYVRREVIAPIYLVDAGIEVVLIVAWLAAGLAAWRSQPYPQTRLS